MTCVDLQCFYNQLIDEQVSIIAVETIRENLTSMTMSWRPWSPLRVAAAAAAAASFSTLYLQETILKPRLFKPAVDVKATLS